MPTRRPEPLILLHSDDTVAVAARALEAGEVLEAGGRRIAVAAPVPRGHKLALRDAARGDPVHKYGQVIGFATEPIAAGQHVHVHNLGFQRFAREAAYDTAPASLPPFPADLPRTFQGIRRPDGRAATRNYIGVLTSVNCSATAGRLIADQFRGPGALADFPRVDGVVALTHGSGCGMAVGGEGFTLLRRTLTGYARHPNFAGLLVIGLGCEDNQLATLAEGFDLPETTPVATMTIQQLGGLAATVREGAAKIRELLPEADRVAREPVDVAELVLGLECGGSDAYSGISANPALGYASDLLVAAGGTGVLGETPEIYGAEHLLTRRAVRPEVAKKLLGQIEWWERYTAAHGGSMDNNPSPGNKEGGLTTILEKSLGAIAKGGRAPLQAVYEYAEPVRERGFVFMDTPGYDPASVTGFVAGGANVVCFTTGRGSVYGCKPVPSLKLATNSEMYAHMSEDMDINCGTVLDGEATVEQAGRHIFERVVAAASGEATLSEQLGLGDEEFTPWQVGAVM